jgi:hypothetical protein
VCTAQEIGFTLIEGPAVSPDTRIIPMMTLGLKIPFSASVPFYIKMLNMDSDEAFSLMASITEQYPHGLQDLCAAS